MIGEGEFYLLFILFYRCDIYFIPLGGQCFLCMSVGPIKWNCFFTSVHTKTKCNWLICSQFQIEFFHIIVHKSLHLLYYPYWDSKCQVKAHWQLHISTSCNIVLTTYRCTCSDIHSLSTTVNQMYTGELTFAVKQVTCKLIPVCTCSMLIE